MKNYKRFKERLKALNDDPSTYYKFLSSARSYITWNSRLAGPEVGKRKSEIQDQAVASYKKLEEVVLEINKTRKFRIPTDPDLLNRFAEGFVNYARRDMVIEELVQGNTYTGPSRRHPIMN